MTNDFIPWIVIGTLAYLMFSNGGLPGWSGDNQSTVVEQSPAPYQEPPISVPEQSNRNMVIFFVAAGVAVLFYFLRQRRKSSVLDDEFYGYIERVRGREEAKTIKRKIGKQRLEARRRNPILMLWDWWVGLFKKR